MLPSMACSNWTTARRTFPRQRLAGSRAMPRWCTCATTPRATSSRSGVRRAPFPRPFAAPRRARHLVPIPRLHCPTVRRSSRSPLGRRRRHEPRQPDASLSTSSSRRPRGRIRCGPPSRWNDDLRPARRHAARRRAGAPTLAARVARSISADPRDTTDVGWHAARHRLGDRRPSSPR